MAHLTIGRLTAFGTLLWLSLANTEHATSGCLVQRKAAPKKTSEGVTDDERPLTLSERLGVLYIPPSGSHEVISELSENRLLHAVQKACDEALFCDLHVVNDHTKLSRMTEANIAVVLGNVTRASQIFPAAMPLQLQPREDVDLQLVLSNLRSSLAKARAQAVLEAMRLGRVGV